MLKQNYSFHPLLLQWKCRSASSAIIVQGLANNTLSGSLFNRLIKEVSLSLLNGVILAVILFVGHYLLDVKMVIGVIVTTALVS
jgi:magnesium transporter